MELMFHSGISATTGHGFVNLEVDGNMLGQLSPADMIKLGLRAIQSAIEAERDAGMYAFMVGLDNDNADPEIAKRNAAAMVGGMREHRQQWDLENGDLAATERAARVTNGDAGPED